MHVQCPHCRAWSHRPRIGTGQISARTASVSSMSPEDRKMPPWILGVLVILVANLQIIGQ